MLNRLITILLLVMLLPGVATAQPCLGTYTLTATPPPTNGTYMAGQTVTFCLTITSWNTTNSNWLHGVTPVLGAGWDPTSLVPGTPPTTQGTSTGTWGWFASCTGTSGVSIGTVGPGFFFDLDNNGTPGDNFGDYVSGPCNFQFCWTASVPSGSACVNGTDLSMTAMITSDSETGSWGSSGCTGDPDPVAPATAQCCSADAGLPASIAVCDDGAPVDLFTQLGGTPDLGGTWTDPNGVPFTNPLDPATGSSGAYTYSVVDTMPGCTNAQAAVTVTIANALDPGTNASLALCRDAAPLDLFTVLGGSPDAGGTWTDPGGAAYSGLLDPATATQGAYVYTTNPALPCPTLSATITVSLDTIPYAGTDNTFVSCADGPVTPLFPLLGPGTDANKTWQDPSGNPFGGALDPSLEVSGNYLYISQGIGQCVQLIDTAVIAVTINPLPIVAFMVAPDSGCAPLDVNFTNLTDPAFLGGDCIWDLGDGSGTVNSCSGLLHTFQAPGSYTVTLTVTTPAGCVDHLTRPGAVHVDPPPQASFVWTPDPGTEVAHNVLFSATDPYATVFAWDLAGLGTSEQRQVQYDFQVAYGDDYDICLQVWDRYGCTDTLCQTASIIVPSLFVPNAFTPDGDGVNELFLPITRDMADADHELLVYDRWGQLVFETKEPNKGWDGRHMSGGDVLPQGVYVWRLIERKAYTAEKQDFFGTVTLLK